MNLEATVYVHLERSIAKCQDDPESFENDNSKKKSGITTTGRKGMKATNGTKSKSNETTHNQSTCGRKNKVTAGVLALTSLFNGAWTDALGVFC